jgi:hypothetical protein
MRPALCGPHSRPHARPRWRSRLRLRLSGLLARLRRLPIPGRPRACLPRLPDSLQPFPPVSAGAQLRRLGATHCTTPTSTALQLQTAPAPLDECPPSLLPARGAHGKSVCWGYPCPHQRALPRALHLQRACLRLERDRGRKRTGGRWGAPAERPRPRPPTRPSRSPPSPPSKPTNRPQPAPLPPRPPGTGAQTTDTLPMGSISQRPGHCDARLTDCVTAHRPSACPAAIPADALPACLS